MASQNTGAQPPAPSTTPTDLYAFGNQQQPRAPRPSDFGVNGLNDFVGPESLPTPHGASTIGDPNQAPLTGHYHRLPAGTPLPDGLAVVPDGTDVLPGSPLPPKHHTVFPITRMTLQEFINKFLFLPWQHAGKK